jgi:hypothetical protein
MQFDVDLTVRAQFLLQKLLHALLVTDYNISTWMSKKNQAQKQTSNQIPSYFDPLSRPRIGEPAASILEARVEISFPQNQWPLLLALHRLGGVEEQTTKPIWYDVYIYISNVHDYGSNFTGKLRHFPWLWDGFILTITKCGCSSLVPLYEFMTFPNIWRYLLLSLYSKWFP